MHARVVTSGTMETGDIAKVIQETCTLTTGDIKAVLDSLSNLMVREMSSGKRIHLEGLGYFQLVLSCPPVHTSNEIRAESVRVKSVAFRPEIGLKGRFRNVSLERSPVKRHSNVYSDIEVDGLLTGHFLDNTFITSREFQKLCGFTRSTATRRIKQLIMDGKLRKVGHSRFPLYEPEPGFYRRRI